MGGRWGRATTLSSSTAGGARRFVRVVRFVRGVGFPEQFEAACSSGSGWKLLYFFLFWSYFFSVVTFLFSLLFHRFCWRGSAVFHRVHSHDKYIGAAVRGERVRPSAALLIPCQDTSLTLARSLASLCKNLPCSSTKMNSSSRIFLF